jgi:bacteriocin biosynthesis cyclodehydratase domain-containing protein
VAPEHQGEAATLIERLLARGILTEISKSPIQQYLGYVLTGSTNLADRHVGIIGAGPIGSRLASSLLQHGIGRLSILDDRTTDRHWHALAASGTGGATAAASRADAAVGQHCRQAGYPNVVAMPNDLDDHGVQAITDDADFLVVTLERPSLSLTHMVNRSCLKRSKPWLLLTIDGSLATVGPLFVPPDTACYNDYRTLTEAATPNPEMTRRYVQHLLQRSPSSFFVGLPAYADIVSGFGALAAVHFLVRGTSFALSRVLVVDVDRMVIDVEDVLRLPRCPVCSTKAAEPPFSAEIVTRVQAK